MTLIVAIPAKNGIVIGSDTLITSGYNSWNSQKILEFNHFTLWGASGDVSLIQRVEWEIQALPKDEISDNNTLFNNRETICGIVMRSVLSEMSLDPTQAYYANNPDGLLYKHSGDFIFAEYKDKRSLIFHVMNCGKSELIWDRPFATGSGAPFAYALLSKYSNEYLELDAAAVVAYKVLDEAIAVGSYGIGHPIEIYQIDHTGYRLADTSKLAKSANILTESELQLLKDKVWENG